VLLPWRISNHTVYTVTLTQFPLSPPVNPGNPPSANRAAAIPAVASTSLNALAAPTIWLASDLLPYPLAAEEFFAAPPESPP
jgi:hypothetical protein